MKEIGIMIVTMMVTGTVGATADVIVFSGARTIAGLNDF
jgi:hypothetical protein